MPTPKKDRTIPVLSVSLVAVVSLMVGTACFRNRTGLAERAPILSSRSQRSPESELPLFCKKAIPLIERTTGLTFRWIPKVVLTSAEVFNVSIRMGRKNGVTESFVEPLHLGHYDPKGETVYILTDGFERLRRFGGPSEAKTPDLERLALVHTLVHALDAQHGRFTEALGLLKEGHAEYVTLNIASELGIDDSSVKLWLWTQELRVRPYFSHHGMKSDFGFDYGDEMRFVEALYRSGGSRLVAEVFEHPPCWLAYIPDASLFLADRETEFMQRQKEAMDRLVSLLNKEEWRTLNPLNERVDRYGGDPLPELDSRPSPLWRARVMTFFGTYTTAEGSVEELYATGAPMAHIWLNRFSTSDAAREYVSAARERAKDRLERSGYVSSTMTELEKNSILVDRVRRGDPPMHDYNFFISRGTFVVHLRGSGRCSLEDLTGLWKRLLDETSSEFVGPGR